MANFPVVGNTAAILKSIRNYLTSVETTQAVHVANFKKPTALRDIMQAARANNPYERAVMAVPPTVTVGGHDGTLSIFPLVSGAALSANGNNVAWYGGVPTAIGSAYVAMPVASILPATSGNIGFGLNDLNQWAHAAEIMTDAPTVEFGIYISSLVKVMFQVDGQYVDLAGSAGINATNTDTYFKLAFASRKVRRIRVLVPNNPAKGAVFLKNICLTATCSFWKPDPSSVMRVGWGGDSYSEGTNASGTIYNTPNAAWPVLTCELLGLRDCRQLAVGSTGYVSTASGLRSKFYDQMARWVNQAPFDLLVFAAGYNDASSSAATITAEVTACLTRARTLFGNVPIVVLGCQAGAAGPSAQQITAEGAIAAAVTAFNDPLVKFAKVSTDTPTWLNGTGKVGATNASGNSDVYVDTDGIHPSLAGAEYLAYRSAAAIRNAVASMCV